MILFMILEELSKVAFFPTGEDVLILHFYCIVTAKMCGLVRDLSLSFFCN